MSVDQPHEPPRRGPQRLLTWRRVAIAATLSAALAAGNPAWALALGRVTVQSQLGEPLRAEIDLPALTEAEAATLQLELAGPERYRSASLEYAPWLRDVTLQLQRRPDGRAVIVVRSERPVSEPFVDLVVVARWAGGELLRGYTLLFDPPQLRAPAPVMPAVTPPAPVAAPVPAAPPTPPDSPAARSTAADGPARAAPVPANAAPSSAARRLVVRPGDTAGRIAQQHRPPGATLEQTLVALLRANPQAFIRGNVHLLKAGAVIDLPDAQAVGGVDAQEARTLVAAQTRDFNAYRRRLAATAPTQHSPQAQTQAQGKVQTEVADAAPQASAPDKLTLSKPGHNDDSARVAVERQQQEQQQRVAELERNLRELEQLRQQSSASAPAAAPATAEGTGSPAAAPVPSTEASPAPPPAPPAPPAAPAAAAVPAPPPAPAAAAEASPVQAVL
ncbi:MAG: hypothetical protein NZ694_02780, partial [Tepidimonas sp.]|nr:hypothetical protein [Tepidimonas sp.]